MVAPSLYFLQDKFHPEILMGSPEWGVKQGRAEENKPLALNVNMSETV